MTSKTTRTIRTTDVPARPYIAVGEFLRDVVGDCEGKTPQQEEADAMAALCIVLGTVLIVSLVLSVIFYAAGGQ